MPRRRSSASSAARRAASATARGRSTWTCCCSATCRSSSERLSLPHPEVTRRRFVLEPLLELDPSLTLPDGTPLAGELDAVLDQPVRRAGAL